MKSQLPTTKNSKGFTLVELLIVVAIIAILAIVGISVYGNVQRGAKDSRRAADIRSMSQAMEASYNSTAGSYYQLNTGMFASGAIPTDPGAPTNNYSGTMTGTAGSYLSGNTYSFCATQEGSATQFCMKNQR